MVSIRRTGVSIKQILARLCKVDFRLADEESAFMADNLDIPFTTVNRYIRTLSEIAAFSCYLDALRSIGLRQSCVGSLPKLSI